MILNFLGIGIDEKEIIYPMIEIPQTSILNGLEVGAQTHQPELNYEVLRGMFGDNGREIFTHQFRITDDREALARRIVLEIQNCGENRYTVYEGITEFAHYVKNTKL